MKPQAPGKKVAVLGIGKSGYESAVFLHSRGFQVFASDQGHGDSIRAAAGELKRREIEVEFGSHSTDRILASDWVLISPGIPPPSPIYQTLLKKGIPVFSEIEVASWYCPSSKIIAITGSAGKTTVTTLITRVLQNCGFRAVSCGNIGNPWIGELAKIEAHDFVVLEVSSFQLQHCKSFHPQAAVLLNLSPNHQDWHRDMKEYVQAKLRLFQNQNEKDWAVLRREDQRGFFPDFQFRSRVIYFDVRKEANPNEEAVRAVTGLFGCHAEKTEEVLRGFEGIEHRLEKVAVLDRVTYVNDSKSTTPAALAWALGKFPDARVILLAGGHPKSSDFHHVRELLSRKTKAAILIGEARPLLREAWQGLCPLHETGDFRQAVLKAHQLAAPGDVVLLSPACASFDMFQNYEERGRLFKSIVNELASLSIPT